MKIWHHETSFDDEFFFLLYFSIAKNSVNQRSPWMDEISESHSWRDVKHINILNQKNVRKKCLAATLSVSSWLHTAGHLGAADGQYRQCNLRFETQLKLKKSSKIQRQVASFCASFCAAVLHFWVQMPWNAWFFRDISHVMPKGLLTPPDVAYRPRRIELLPIRPLCVKRDIRQWDIVVAEIILNWMRLQFSAHFNWRTTWSLLDFLQPFFLAAGLFTVSFICWY